MAAIKTLGVTFSRTLIPTLPAGYLSRKRLFPLIENESSGTTFVIAPGGYGKSSLVAEWAQYQSKGVIWMTVANGDTLNEMSAMLIAATRQVIPHFAPWFENEHPLRPTEVVKRWGNELLQTNQEFVFVLDNLRSETEKDVDIAVSLIEQFPTNIHFISIRREEIQSIYPTCASRGPIKVITTSELRFNEEEIELYAANAGFDLTPANKKILKLAHGWPSATSLLRAHLQAQGENTDLEYLMSNEIEPLRALALVVVRSLDPLLADLCERLSVVKNFDLEIAQIILGNDYSFELINSIAHRGEIFTMSRDPKGGYSFSPMMQNIFLENLRKRSEVKLEIHRALIDYFEKIGLPSLAIDHAFEAGDSAKISELFPDAARLKQAQGFGGDLLRWARYAGDSSREGQLKQATVEVAGLLADLDFGAAASVISKINLLAEGVEGEEFYRQFIAGADSYSHLTLAKFDELEASVLRSKSGLAGCLLGVDDQINLLRLLAAKNYLWDDESAVSKIYDSIRKLAQQSNLRSSHTFLQSVEAMVLHQKGEYRRAYEIAVLVQQESLKYGFVGNHGPLDVMYVQARTLLEFSKRQEAMEMFDQIRSLAYQWKQWHWFIACDNHIIQELCLRNQEKDGLERIRVSRELVATLEPTHKLATMIDTNEMYVRRRLKDFDRLEKLVARANSTRNTQQMKMAVDEFRGRKVIHEDAKNLLSHTPREAIWKHLTIASLNIDAENVALPAVRDAMKVGSLVGAKETFLRQRDEIGNLIIKVANDYPTVYNEELASAMAERMRERGSTMKTAQQALTKRELEILRQLSTGRTLTVIAGELHISQNTMKTHLKNLYKKMGAEGRHDAVEKAKSTFLM